MSLQKYVINDSIDIPKKDWQELKDRYKQQELVDALNSLVEENNIEFRLRGATLDRCRNDYETLKEFDTSILLTKEEWKSKFEYRYALNKVYISKTSIGKNASNYFMQEERHKVSSHNKSSIHNAWYDKKLRTQTFNALFTMKRTHVNNSTILQTAECKHYLPSAFRPTAAKTIYDLCKAKRILDMSAGWGDRLVASCGREYLGFDPNTKLQSKYEQIIQTHNLNAEIQPTPFEDSNLPDNFFDVMFSSPPYFACELYSDEDTQSCNRYKTVNTWLNNFLFKSIDKIYYSLTTGGTLAINISDINIKGKRQFICDKMNDYIGGKGFTYLGCIGLQLSKLPNTQSKTTTIFGEPIWIWRK